MRKLLLENVSSVSEGSQVTPTWLTAQELDKIRIIKKKKIENLLSHLFILNIKILWKVQTRLGVTSCCPGGTSSSSVGAPDSVLENREGSPGRIRAKFWHLWL